MYQMPLKFSLVTQRVNFAGGSTPLANFGTSQSVKSPTFAGNQEEFVWGYHTH